MFNPDITPIFKPSVNGRYTSDMENVDIMLNYDSNEFMDQPVSLNLNFDYRSEKEKVKTYIASSDFFDTIRSVENGIPDDFLNSPIDDFNTSSDTSSHIDGYLSTGNDISESERSNSFTDESASPIRTVDPMNDPLLDFLQPTENEFEVEAQPVIITAPKPSKFIIQNPTSKKIVNKTITHPSQLKKIGKKQILKVQSLSPNGKPVILPYGLKGIKILNASDRIHVTTLPSNSVCRRKVEPNRLKEVKLTSEEKRLLDKEGIQLPAYHPLTKMEDRELKRIRRKIRNKISAQDSRKRKKEYVDGLEERVRRGSEENRNLIQRVKELQKKNKTLMAHINKLQSLIFNSTSSKATPSTCLMIVMLSVLLVSIPNIRLPKSSELSTEQEQVTIGSRSLLSTQKIDDDTLNMEEFFIFNKDDDGIENNTESEYFKALEEMEKYEFRHSEKNIENGNFYNTFVENVKNLFKTDDGLGSYFNTGDLNAKRKFIEPDIDDLDPVMKVSPAKKMKLVDDFHHQNDENFFANNVVSATVQTNMEESKDK